MPWVTMDAEAMKRAHEEERAAYTWDDCTRDLALMTSLTAHEALEVTREVRESEISPYDALPPLKDLFGENTIGMRARALRRLLAEAFGAGHDSQPLDKTSGT